MAIVPKGRPPALYDAVARTAQSDGTRGYQQLPDTASGVLVDEHGRLIVRAVAGSGGYSTPDTIGAVTVPQSAGSAPQYDNVGLVQTHRVMQSPNDAGVPVTQSPNQYVARMFGYAAVAGWVQLILKDESGGANPPVLNDVPEITIAVTADANFFFGDWPLTTAVRRDLATYIAFSTTGPTYTPGGANLWFAYHGGV